jgi:hypothetical protein
MKREHSSNSNSSGHLNSLLLSPPPSLELLLLERAKALQQHHHQQQQQQHHNSNTNAAASSAALKSFPHFPSQGFGGLRSGLFPGSPLPALLAGGAGDRGSLGGFSNAPEELLQRWRQQLPHQLPANIQEDSRMDITVASTAATPQSLPPSMGQAEAMPDFPVRQERSPSPAASLKREAVAVSPPCTTDDDHPAILNGGDGGSQPLGGDEDEVAGEDDVSAVAAAEDEEPAATAPSETGTSSPGRYHENNSPTKSEDSNLGELTTTPQLAALSPLSPYSNALGLGLPSLLSSASR